jgi:Gluconate 2-dehydrogenase subunit 3
MQRREALKLLAASATLPLIPIEAFSLFRAAYDELPQNPGLKTLNSHQNETVVTISDLIIPATDTPGAKAVRVNEFIDVILSEWCDDAERERFLAGLNELDSRSRELAGKDFVGCSQMQQVRILQTLEDQWAGAPTRREVDHTHDRVTQDGFFPMIKRLTLIGYYTSQIGFEQELRQQIIPRRHAGCAPAEEALEQ